MAEKLIITCALTGGITIPTMSEHLPLTPQHLVQDAIQCCDAGAAAVHIHARDPVDGRPSSDPDIFERILSGIAASSNVVIGITTGGGMGMTAEERLMVIPRFRPEVASFNLGSMNFSIHPSGRRYKPEDYKYAWERAYVEGTKNFIFRNTFGDMEAFAATFAENDVRAEFEAYDVGHLHSLRFLWETGVVKPPLWIQFVMGVLGGIAATAEGLMTMKQTADRLFGQDGYRWSVIGVGYPAQFHMTTMAIVLGGHARVGLEDNIYVSRGRRATNAELVEKIVRIARELDREIATPDEAREMLGLKGAARTNFRRGQAAE